MLTVNAHGAIGFLVVAVSLIQGCASTNSVSGEPLLGAAASAPNSSYVMNNDNDIVLSADELCVRTARWNSEDLVAACGNVEVVAEAEAEAPGSVLVAYNGRALFEFDSSVLTGAGEAELDTLTAKLNSQDKITGIEIIGHADNVGSDAYNQNLSEQRAESVKSYLQRSLRTVAVTASGLGESAPIADNDTELGRSLNRRVDVKIAATVEQ